MDEAQARKVLAAAGLPGGQRDGGQEAELLALGENAVFALGDLVVKVGRDPELLERARHELTVAGWLMRPGSRRPCAPPSRSRSSWTATR